MPYIDLPREEIAGILNPDQFQSLQRVIDYLWIDEHRSWNEEGQPKEGHIMNDIFALQNFVIDNRKTCQASISTLTDADEFCPEDATDGIYCAMHAAEFGGNHA